MPVKLVDRKVYADGIPWDIFPAFKRRFRTVKTLFFCVFY